MFWIPMDFFVSDRKLADQLHIQHIFSKFAVNQQQVQTHQISIGGYTQLSLIQRLRLINIRHIRIVFLINRSDSKKCNLQFKNITPQSTCQYSGKPS